MLDDGEDDLVVGDAVLCAHCYEFCTDFTPDGDAILVYPYQIAIEVGEHGIDHNAEIVPEERYIFSVLVPFLFSEFPVDHLGDIAL